MPRTSTSIICPKALRARHVGYTLSNGVKCIIVTDANAKIPTASMAIHTGKLNDPVEIPGLAHFCEHMLFMGTGKFPVENEYDQYISKNNGHNNAYTMNNATVFYFTVSEDALGGALERFVEFFVAPSFNSSAMGRELQAVHSEDEKNHNVDYWRMDEVLQSLYNQHHPLSRYGNGNKTTLVDDPSKAGVDLASELRKFYDKYYVAGGACMTVCSTFEPETVLGWIEAPLLRMRPGHPAGHRYLQPNESLFDPSALGSWLNLKTVKKTRSLCMNWPVRCSSDSWKSMPSAYISHILGHECDSSVLGVLRRRNYATGMIVGPEQVDDDNVMLFVSIQLTVEGFQNVDSVVSHVYQGIGQACVHGIDRRVYNEMKKEEQLIFESAEVGSIESHCSGMAVGAITSDMEHAWIADSVILEDDLEAVAACCAQLVPSNCVMTLKWGDLPMDLAKCVDAPAEVVDCQGDSSSDEDGDDGEDDNGAAEVTAEELFNCLPEFARVRANCCTRFHGAKYGQTRVPDSYIAKWTGCLCGPYTDGLALPLANPFLATDYTIFPGSKADVALLQSAHGITLIRKDDGHHHTFKACAEVNIISPVAYISPLSRLYSQVMVKVVRDAAAELCYYGELAALTNAMTCNPGGITTVVAGPYQNLCTFMLALLKLQFDLEVLQGTEEKYCNFLEKYIRSLEGLKSRQPYEMCLDRIQCACARTLYTFDDILPVAAQASYGGYKEFVADYIRQGILFECFSAGNIPSTESFFASLIGEGVEGILRRAAVQPVAPASIPRFRDGVDLGTSGAYSDHPGVVAAMDCLSFAPFNHMESNAAVVLNIFVGAETPALSALSECAAKLISPLFFAALRTRETLGYVVFVQTASVYQARHVRLAAQSALDGVDGVYLLSRITAFLAALEDRIDELITECDVKSIAAGLILAREKRPDGVVKDASQLRGGYYNPGGLEHRQAEIDFLKNVTVEGVKAFVRQFVLNSRTHARALLVVVNSPQTEGANVLAGSGVHHISLPAKRESTEEPDSDCELVLPTYASDPPDVEVATVESIKAYRMGRGFIESRTL